MNQIVNIAREWVGTPYMHQQAAKGRGCDCLGLLRGIFHELYPNQPVEPIPAYSPYWIAPRTEIGRQELLLRAATKYLTPTTRAALKPGDVMLVKIDPRGPFKHCAIVTKLDPLTIIHAYETAGVVEVAYPQVWQRKEVRHFRFPEVK